MTIGIRPESLRPDQGVGVEGTIIGIEPLGRKTLYEVTLPDGCTLGSIQAGRAQANLGRPVRWAVDPNELLFFGEDGTRSSADGIRTGGINLHG